MKTQSYMKQKKKFKYKIKMTVFKLKANLEMI